MCLTCGCGDESNVRVLTADGGRPRDTTTAMTTTTTGMITTTAP